MPQERKMASIFAMVASRDGERRSLESWDRIWVWIFFFHERWPVFHEDNHLLVL